MRYLITGASSGIGKCCAERLLSKGNECLLLARSGEKLSEIKESFEQAYSEFADLTDLRSIESVFDRNSNLFPFDGMIHCAGVAPLKRIDENDINTVQNTYMVNVLSFVELMRCFVKDGVCKDGSSVVVMSSVVAHRGSNRQAVYSGTKAALEATIRCMAKELLPRRIRLNAIVSATVDTAMLQKLRTESLDLDEKIKQHSPLGIVPIDEVCDLIEYLLSESSMHMTGASVPIDAGYFL